MNFLCLTRTQEKFEPLLKNVFKFYLSDMECLIDFQPLSVTRPLRFVIRMPSVSMTIRRSAISVSVGRGSAGTVWCVRLTRTSATVAMPMPPVSSTSTPSLTPVSVTQGSQGTADTALSLVSISNSNYAVQTRRFFCIEN